MRTGPPGEAEAAVVVGEGIKVGPIYLYGDVG